MLKAFTNLTFAVILTSAIYSPVVADQPNEKDASQSPEQGKFVVHEWGTFTTFSGSDGVFLDFRPLDASHNDLPDYVLDRGSLSQNPVRFLGKRRLWGRVRMETPVTYFYTDRHRTVDVRVDFPQGMLTEFYPPVRQILPPIDEQNIFGAGETMGHSSLDWGKVDIIPVADLVPNVKDAYLRESIAASIVHGLVPHAANEQHYAAARETDAALVRYQASADKPSFFEKFLFYRGVGKFQLPITTQFKDGRAIFSNSGNLPISSAILIDVQGEMIQAKRINGIQQAQSIPFDEMQSVSNEQLGQMVRECLVAEGLYEKEAAAMVATWQQSWFTEKGTRVLYMVPEATTNQLLPLRVTPQPQKMLRVLVGRMEIMSPTSEQEMTKEVAQSIAARAKHTREHKARGSNAPYAIPERIQAFGRMAEPALARILHLTADNSIRNEADLLIHQLRTEGDSLTTTPLLRL